MDLQNRNFLSKYSCLFLHLFSSLMEVWRHPGHGEFELVNNLLGILLSQLVQQRRVIVVRIVGVGTLLQLGE